MTDRWPWGPLSLEQGATTELGLGALRLTVRRTAGELWYRATREEAHEWGDRPGWRRWALPSDARIELRPATPDRLLVVSHEYPFHLPPRGRARVFIRLLLFVRLFGVVAGREDVALGEEPAAVLSDTWWGSIEEGELAYWLTTKARSEVSGDLFEPHLAMCPVSLENRSPEALPVDRFAVRATHLSLFEVGRRVWTDELRVRYVAAEEGSEIEFGGRAPPEAKEASALAAPREPVHRGFQARTFDRLRSMALGGG